MEESKSFLPPFANPPIGIESCRWHPKDVTQGRAFQGKTNQGEGVQFPQPPPDVKGGKNIKIYFHTQEKTIDICGSDRALMWHLCKSITNGFIDAQNFTASEINQVKSLLPTEHYLQSCSVREWVQMFTTYMSVTDNLGYFSVFEMQLNTAILFGSDAIKLAARIHGQCEVHGWFSTKNKEWLCKMIDQGVEVGIFRDPNWQKLQQLAQETKSDRIVMSYSVCNSFPTGAGWDDALSSLNQELEISPQNLNTLFGDSVTGFSFRDWLKSH